jgi:hypothetical protein
MGAAGRALAEREFDVERVARIQVELYDELSRVSGTRTGRS